VFGACFHLAKEGAILKVRSSITNNDVKALLMNAEMFCHKDASSLQGILFTFF
jgi:hypothetical protein